MCYSSFLPLEFFFKTFIFSQYHFNSVLMIFADKIKLFFRTRLHVSSVFIFIFVERCEITTILLSVFFKIYKSNNLFISTNRSYTSLMRKKIGALLRKVKCFVPMKCILSNRPKQFLYSYFWNVQYLGETETNFNIRLNSLRLLHTNGRICRTIKLLLRTVHYF